MLENSVGLEAEFFLLNEHDELVFPADNGFPCDDFIILGEIRGVAGKNREETVSNFLKEYYRISFLAGKKNLKISIIDGWKNLEPKFYTTVIRKIEQKTVSKCENIYDYDLLSYSDSIVENGKLIGHKISIGLHIHFSSIDKTVREFTEKRYDNVKLPLQVSSVDTCLDLFAYRGENKIQVVSQCNRITKPVIKHIVSMMDKEIYPQFKINEVLKYRLPGFFEVKESGRFEYRSLPFNEQVLQNIPKIVDYAYGLLETL